MPEEDWATALGICTKNLVKIGLVVPEICSQTDWHTHRQTNWSQYSAPLAWQSTTLANKTDQALVWYTFYIILPGNRVGPISNPEVHTGHVRYHNNVKSSDPSDHVQWKTTHLVSEVLTVQPHHCWPVQHRRSDDTQIHTWQFTGR